MIDAYSSVGMPVGYHHWSYGKQFLATQKSYKRGQMGLAYEIVINSNPCIAYLMEENTMTMQALVIAHAAYGHNSFFKGNYLFRTWTDAEAIIDYLVFARNYIAECEAALRRGGGGSSAGFLPRPDELRRRPLQAPRQLSMAKEQARQIEREAYLQSQVNDLWRTLPARQEAEQGRARPSASRASPRKTCFISSRRTPRAWNPGSARSCASCARSPSISIRSARPRS